MDSTEFEQLLPFCDNPLQEERLRLYYELGTFDAVAAHQGRAKNAIVQSIRALRLKAARVNVYPAEIDDRGRVPPGYFVERQTVQVGPNGTERKWVKSKVDQEQAFALAQAALDELLADVVPAPPVPLQTTGPDDLLNCFIVTDYHLGMQAWGEETRDEDWDLAIAERLLLDWFRVTIDRMPAARTAVFAQLGDFLHWDGLEAVTPTAGHVLDADTRFQKLVRVAIRVLRECTRLLLERHEHVHLIHAEGNHDLASSIWLREMFAAFYENEPRITVDRSVDPYYAYQHGRTGLFFHHGHKRKTPSLDQVLARKFRRIYGEVDHAYAHAGHLHFDKVEGNLMVVEQHRTLAASDAYASRHGWMSGRDAKGITYSKKYGEVGRATVNPDLVRDTLG